MISSFKINALEQWVCAYRESVGPAADDCVVLLQSLLAQEILEPSSCELMVELLEILDGLGADAITVSCALLHVAGEGGGRLDEIVEARPGKVRKQHAQLKQLKLYESDQTLSTTKRSAEGLRRLLLALVNDVRVVMIDLAWQLVLLRHAKADQVVAQALARETMLIHAPLANQLGIWQLKWELEDLAFRYQDPEHYRRIAQLVAEHRTERERFIQGFMDKLSAALDDADIPADVKGRPKHMYSIWRKMQRKGLDFHDLFDVRAVRVLVDDVPACYSALGLVHTYWQPIPGEFDDYITMPKGNNYQSLHTSVADSEGRAVEIQIRTHQMHEHSELGVAAHWRYKEGGPNDPAFDKKIAVMRQLLESTDEVLDDQSLLDSFQAATTEDRVYVLTPRGQVVDLAAGSTVLDFAYHIHTEVGHRCRGAKVNGRIVPLTHVVNTGDRVEILTAKQARPSRDWLNPRLGYINGARGRAKVRHWFKSESRDENMRAGKEAVENEASRIGLTLTDFAQVVERFSLASTDDLFVAVGNGDLTVGQVINSFDRLRTEQIEPQAEDLVTRTPKRQRSEQLKSTDDVTIEGVGNLMTTVAKCCQPIPGDPVIGYITRGRGVTIHRDDCRQVLHWQSENNPRLLQVSWGEKPKTNYSVQIQVRAYDRRDLIRDISNILAASDTQVTDISSRLDELLGEVTIRLFVRVRDYEQLSELLNRMGNVINVIEARRLSDGG